MLCFTHRERGREGWGGEAERSRHAFVFVLGMCVVEQRDHIPFQSVSSKRQQERGGGGGAGMGGGAEIFPCARVQRCSLVPGVEGRRTRHSNGMLTCYVYNSSSFSDRPPRESHLPHLFTCTSLQHRNAPLGMRGVWCFCRKSPGGWSSASTETDSTDAEAVRP